MSQTATSMLRGQFKGAHDALMGTVAGLSAEQMHWQPTGKGANIAAQVVHILGAEDGFINGMLKQSAPLMASSFAGKTGIDPVPANPRMGDWAKTVKVDPAALMAYAKAVFESVDAYLSGLQDEDLMKPVDLSMINFGMQNVGFVISITLANTHWHTGEISAVKGFQGLQGYPF